MRVLLVEDDAVIGRSIEQALWRRGFSVDWLRSGNQAVAAVHVNTFDAIVLDLGLPDIPGAELLRQLRLHKWNVPVVVATACACVEDRVRLLDLGADDYVVKPVNPDELAARIRAVMRRASAANDASDVQDIGPLQLYPASRVARWNNAEVPLTGKEFDVLEALVLRRPHVVSQQQLEGALYGWGDDVSSNAIQVYVHMLRRKLTPSLIVTVRGRGYRIGSEALVQERAQPMAAALA